MQEIRTKFSPIKSRIIQFIDYKGISKNKFFRDTGISPSNFKANGAKSELGGEKIVKILSIYPEINPEWLLTGRGEMLRGDVEPVADVPSVVPVDTDLQLLKTKLGNNLRLLPLVTQEAAAGFGNGNFSIKERDVKEYYVVPKFKYHKVDFMIEVYGNSMYPKYNSGDVVACTIINNSNFIQWNKPHVVATKDQGILVKRILQAPEPDKLLLKSDNKDYPPFEVPKTEITGLALVVGVIRSE